MLKKTAITLASVLMLFPANAFSSVDNDITTLDQQRIELLKQVTAGLVGGKISIDDAEKLKGELDDVVKLETKTKEDPLSSPERLQEISSTLNQVRSHIDTAIHPTKVWLGINVHDRNIEQKIDNSLDHKLISKEQAESFKQQFDELVARESNGDPTNGFEFDDALSLAITIQKLNNDIDKASSGK